MNVGFRVDSSKKIGGGHFYRSINFAEFLKKKNKIFFLSKKLSITQIKLLKKKILFLKKFQKKKMI